MLVAAILSLFVAAGCRSAKDTGANGAAGSQSAISTETATGGSLTTRYTALVESWKPWRDLEVNAKVQIASPAKINGAGKVYMKRGEWISVSVRMLGFEVASLWVDSDSVIVMDKFHKKYLMESTARLLGAQDVTISDIQDLLLGRAFLNGKGTATTSNRTAFELRDADNGWYLLPRQQPANFTYGFLVSLTANVLRGAAIDVDGYGSVAANYSDYFESRTSGWFAQEVAVENSRGKKIAATLKWDLNGAKFNAGVSKSRPQPKGYDRINAADLNSLLKSF